MNKILFICTGNYYRSRFAEIYFNSMTTEKNINWSAFSRGFYTDNPNNNGMISAYAREKLLSLNIHLPRDIAYPVKLIETDLLNADKIIALKEDEHKPFVNELFPKWEKKFEYWQVGDIHEEDQNLALKKLTDLLDRLIVDLNKK